MMLIVNISVEVGDRRVDLGKVVPVTAIVNAPGGAAQELSAFLQLAAKEIEEKALELLSGKAEL